MTDESLISFGFPSTPNAFYLKSSTSFPHTSPPTAAATASAVDHDSTMAPSPLISDSPNSSFHSTSSFIQSDTTASSSILASPLILTSKLSLSDEGDPHASCHPQNQPLLFRTTSSIHAAAFEALRATNESEGEAFITRMKRWEDERALAAYGESSQIGLGLIGLAPPPSPETQFRCRDDRVAWQGLSSDTLLETDVDFEIEGAGFR